MCSTDLSKLLAEIKNKGRVEQNDILALRKQVFGDNAISMDEADALFTLNQLSQKPVEWQDFFIDAITNFLVRQTLPKGYVSRANAMWLMARIDHDGVIETHTELELLLNIMKRADNVTEELEVYALTLVKYAVLNGTGFLGKDRALQAGVIGEAEVNVLKRVLYSCSSEDGIGISKREAEVIFDLNDACAHAKNHESWTRLFVGAIANHIMMLASWNEPEAREALRREKWLEGRGDGFLLPKFEGFTEALISIFSKPTALKFTNMNKVRTRQAERVNAGEANWLIERLSRDGQLHENERALLRFLKEESPQIHESLLPYLEVA